MKTKVFFIAGLVAYLGALALMHMPHTPYIDRIPISMADDSGRSCPGTLWLPANPDAVILIGHGVSSNQGVMALFAKAYARNGYVAITFDFSGHGHDREKFDWSSNNERIRAWVAHARSAYPGLPLAYLGHSMGGFAGASVFLEHPEVDAFIALGALPGDIPSCPTLVAAGIFEELFSIEQAHETVGDRADIVSSPWSNHATETFDPVLISRTIAWTDRTLKREDSVQFPWGTWFFSLLATATGCVGALMLSMLVAGAGRNLSGVVKKHSAARRWSLNPYRMAAALSGIRGVSCPPRSTSLPAAIARGILFGVVAAVLLALLLDVHIFTVSIGNMGRLLTWLLLAIIVSVPVSVDVFVLERVPLETFRNRLIIAALTRITPLLILAIALRFFVPGTAFLGMIFGIFAFVVFMLNFVHALATRATSDYRAGAAATVVLLAWVVAFWFPRHWPWV